jgi:cysteine desulfurase
MHSNNEVGTLMPIREIATVARAQGVLTHTDVAQSLGKVPVDVNDLGVDLLTVAGHKLYAPKGVGVLYVRHGSHLLAQQHGGGQERHRRAGTEDVASAVGMAVAYELTRDELPDTARRLRRLRERLQKQVLGVEGTELTGHPRDRLPGLLSIICRDTDGNSVVLALDLEGVAAAVGSACTSGSLDPSHVLAAMGYPDEEARGSLRLSLGRTTTEEEVDRAAEIVPRVLQRQRAAAASLAPIAEGVGV